MKPTAAEQALTREDALHRGRALVAQLRVLAARVKRRRRDLAEREYVRDDSGRFAPTAGAITSRSIDTGGAIEGAGPAREKYLALHQAVLAAATAEDREKAEAALTAQEPAMRMEVITNVSRSVAKELGIDPSRITVTDGSPESFTVAGKVFDAIGLYNPQKQRIFLNANRIDHADTATVKGVAAHELMHYINDRLDHDVQVTDEMVKENGHSAYAQTYWAKGATGPAIRETLAEVSRYLVSPESWHEEGHPEPNSKWVALAKGLIEKQQAHAAYIASPAYKAFEEAMNRPAPPKSEARVREEREVGEANRKRYADWKAEQARKAKP